MAYEPLNRGRFIVPKPLLERLEWIAECQRIPVKQWMAEHLTAAMLKTKVPLKPPPPPPPPPEDHNPLFFSDDREFIIGHAFCAKRGTDEYGNKYTDQMWFDQVQQYAARERASGIRYVRGPNGKVMEVKVGEPTPEYLSPYTKKEREYLAAVSDFWKDPAASSAAGTKHPTPQDFGLGDRWI